MDKGARLLGQMKLLTFEINESAERVRQLKCVLKKLYVANAIAVATVTGGFAALIITGLYAVAILLAVIALPVSVILWIYPMLRWAESLKDKLKAEDKVAYKMRREYIKREVAYDYHLLAGDEG